MEYCQKCVMPDTRPGVKIIGGLCNGCRHTEHKKTVDWTQRKRDFTKLCQKYKRQKNEYDCIIAVSSGKDSFFQVYTLREFGMNPLLVSVDNLDWSETGKHNFQVILDTFGCDCLVLKNSRTLNRKMIKIAFEEVGYPAWLWDRLVYTYPLHMSHKMNIPLIIYGENTSLEYGGPLDKETPSAKDQLKNDAVRDYGWDFWTSKGVSMDDLNLALEPSTKGLDPQYLSYYFNWSGHSNAKLAKQYGWKSLNDTGEWHREGFIEDYDQIDDIMYTVDPWMKLPKYAHARTTDTACYLIRDGLLERDRAISLVKEHDYKLDPTALEHFLKFTGYSEPEFWNIVEKFWNREIFEKVNGKWKIKNPIWERK